MSTIALGAILVVAGFAIQPVQQAQAVHTTIQASSLNVLRLTAAGVTPATAATDRATWTMTTPFVVQGLFATDQVDAGNDCNLAAAVVNTNLLGNLAVVEPNPAIFVAVGDSVPLILTADSGALGGTTQLRVLTAAEATCAATDSSTIDAFVLTNSNTTPAAVID